MSEPRKILGEFVSYEEKEFYGVNKYVISYKQPSSADASKVWKHQAVESALTDKAVELLVGLNAGERLCVHQDKDEKGYPIIVDITDAKDVPAKASFGAKYAKGGNSVPRDDSGIAVGAAYTNAIEMVKLIGHDGDLDALIKLVDETAAKILVNKLAQEGKLKASKAANAAINAVSDKVAEVVKPKSRAELLKEKKAEQESSSKTKVSGEIIEQGDTEIAELEEDDLDGVRF